MVPILHADIMILLSTVCQDLLPLYKYSSVSALAIVSVSVNHFYVNHFFSFCLTVLLLLRKCSGENHEREKSLMWLECKIWVSNFTIITFPTLS